MIFDDLEFADLLRSNKAVNGITELRKFFLQTFVNDGLKVKRSICRVFQKLIQKLIQYRLGRFAEGVRDNVSQLDIGNRETILQTIFSLDLKQVSDPFGIFLVSFLSTDSLNIFGMGKDD